ncbi:uncharacterized protein LOC129942200 isoform X2 [Eupeodes corollae]|uniref:uncharacterized protein LOC129942200 isoform X2 n=1 Tax=Eupeodes corollae TaxID=290404 RepID=UPI0024938B58|nr:uncharacterized protein LOC129942200 isoform X2 [Eupeodes corollae]
MEIQHKNKPPTMEKKKKVWSNDETLGFLYCYFARKHEFQQKGYQKCAYENVLKDMIDQGFTNSSTTITALRYRMRHLLVSYREVIKNPHKLENNANIIHLYMNEMDAIFGGQDLINDTVEGDSEELEKVDAPLVMPMVKICVDSPVFKVHPVNNKSTHIDSSCEDLSQSSLCLNNFTAEEQQLHMQLCPKIEITETDEETALETKGNYWSRENVLLLLNCYNARKDDFNIKGKKKYAYENLLKDMIEKGFTYSAPNVSCVRSKLQMDAIFGDQTTMNKSTEVDCFVGVFKKTPVAPKINIKTRSRATKTSQQTNSTDKDEPDISSQSQPSHHSKKPTDEDELHTPSQHSENIDKGTSLTPIVHRSPRQTTDEDKPHIQSKHSLNMDEGTPLKPTIHGSRRKATDGDDTHTLLQHSENIDKGTLLTPIIHGSPQKTSDEDKFSEEQQLHVQLCPKEETTKTETKGKCWSREETLGLLKCYSARKDDFNIKGKKKYAYENLLKDMIEKGFTYSAPNVSSVRSKLRKLLSDYRSAKMDPKKAETKENINNLYFKEMDAIFGDQTTMNKSTEVDCFVGVFKKTPVAPKINIKTRSRATKTSQQTNSTDKDEPDISSQSQPSHHSKKPTDEDELHTPSQHSENIDKGTSLTPIVHRSPRQTTDEDKPHIQSKHSLNMDEGTPLKPTIHGSRRKATDGDDTHTLLQHSENIDKGTLLTPIIHGSPQKTSDEDKFSEEQQLHVQLCPKEETTKTETKGKCWSREETLGLLKCYSARKDDFNIKGKKKYAYENLLKDMIEKGFTHSTTSLPAVVGKMRKLLYAYESAKNDPKKAETKESINNLYFKEMDAIFGDQPRMNKSTEGDSFVAVYKKKQVSPKINFKTRSTTKTSHQTNSIDKDEPDTSSQFQPSQHSENMDEGTPHTPIVHRSTRKTTDEDESHIQSQHSLNMDEGTPLKPTIHGSRRKATDGDDTHTLLQHSENIDEGTLLTPIIHGSPQKTSDEDEFLEEQQLHMQLCPKEETTKTETKGKCWSREETLGLLKCYSARKDDFNIKGKKKYAYENLLKDMIEKGFTHSTTSLPAVVGKMRKLLYAYESAKNDPKKAETIESINNLYFKEMDAIFGDLPRMNNSTEGDFVAVFKKKPFSPKINFKTRSSTTKTSHQTNSTDKDEPDTSSQSKPSQHSKNMDEGTPLTAMILGSPRKTTDEDESHTLSHHFENRDEGTPQTTIIHGSPQKTTDEDELHSSSQHSENIDEETPLTLISHESAPKTNNHSLLGKRKAAEEMYFAKKLKLKREEIRDRKLAREANHNQREKFMRTYLDGLQNKWKKDQELEMRKLELLEKLINKK